MDNIIKKEYELSIDIASRLRKSGIASVNFKALSCLREYDEELYKLLLLVNKIYLNGTVPENILEINNWLNYWEFFGEKASTDYNFAKLLLRTKYFESKLFIDFEVYDRLLMHFYSLLLANTQVLPELTRDTGILAFISDIDSLISLIAEMVRIFVEKHGAVPANMPLLSSDICDYADIIKAGYNKLVPLKKS